MPFCLHDRILGSSTSPTTDGPKKTVDGFARVAPERSLNAAIDAMTLDCHRIAGR